MKLWISIIYVYSRTESVFPALQTTTVHVCIPGRKEMDRTASQGFWLPKTSHSTLAIYQKCTNTPSSWNWPANQCGICSRAEVPQAAFPIGIPKGIIITHSASQSGKKPWLSYPLSAGYRHRQAQEGSRPGEGYTPGSQLLVIAKERGERLLSASNWIWLYKHCIRSHFQTWLFLCRPNRQQFKERKKQAEGYAIFPFSRIKKENARSLHSLLFAFMYIFQIGQKK